MNGKKLFTLMNHIDEDLILDAMPLAHKGMAPPPRRKHHPFLAIGRFMESGVAAAVLSILVAGGIMVGIVMAARMASDPSYDGSDAGALSGNHGNIGNRPTPGLDEEPNGNLPEPPVATDIDPAVPGTIVKPDTDLIVSIRAPQFTDQSYYLNERYCVWESARARVPNADGSENAYEADGPGALYQIDQLADVLKQKPLSLPMNATSLAVTVNREGMTLIGAAVVWEDSMDTLGPAPGYSQPKKIQIQEDGTLVLNPLRDHGSCYLILTVRYTYSTDIMDIDGSYEYAVYVDVTEEPVMAGLPFLLIGTGLYELSEPHIVSGQFTRPLEDGVTAEDTVRAADRLTPAEVEEMASSWAVPKLIYTVQNGKMQQAPISFSIWSGQSRITIPQIRVYDRSTFEEVAVFTDSVIHSLPVKDYIVILDVVAADGVYRIDGKSYNAVDDIQVQLFFLYVAPSDVDNDHATSPDETEAIPVIEGYPYGLVEFDVEDMHKLARLNRNDETAMQSFAESQAPIDYPDVQAMADLLARLPIPRWKDNLPTALYFPGSRTVTFALEVSEIQYQFEVICDPSYQKKLLSKLTLLSTPVDIGDGIQMVARDGHTHLYLMMDGYLTKLSLWGDKELITEKEDDDFFYALTVAPLWGS